MRLDRPVLVGFDGIDGAGKTTLANELVPVVEKLGRHVVRASIDGFHNPSEIRAAKGKLSPEGYFLDSFDYGYLTESFLKPVSRVSQASRLTAANFDWKTNREDKECKIEVHPHSILLFDGVFLFRRELFDFWDLRIFVEIDPDTSLRRGIARDSGLLGGEQATREKYLKRYLPGQRLYLDQYSPRENAHILILNEDPDHPELVERQP